MQLIDNWSIGIDSSAGGDRVGLARRSGGAVVVGRGLSDAAAGLSDRNPAAAESSGSVVRVPGFSFGDGVAATAGEGSTTGCSELDVGVDTGVATTAGESSPPGWSGLGLAAAAGVATTAGESSPPGWSGLGLAAAAGVATTAGEDSTTGWSEFGVGVGVAIPAASGSVTNCSVFPAGTGPGTGAGIRAPVWSLELNRHVAPGQFTCPLARRRHRPSQRNRPGLQIRAGRSLSCSLRISFRQRPAGLHVRQRLIGIGNCTGKRDTGTQRE